MGNYVFTTRRAGRRGHAGRRRRDLAATTSAATSSRCWSSAARRTSATSPSNDVPGVSRARARLLARRRDARRLLRGAHGPDLARPGLQPLQRGVADPDLRPSRCRRRSSCSRSRAARAWRVDSMVCAGVIVSGGVVRRSILSPRVHVHSTREVEGSVLMHERRRRPRRDRAQRDPRQERARRRGSADRRRPGGRPEAVHGLRRRARRGRQGGDG